MTCIHTSRHSNGALVLRLSSHAPTGGELHSTSTDAEELGLWLDAHARTRPAAVVIDLVESATLTSAAVRAIITFATRVRGFGGRPAIAAQRGAALDALMFARTQFVMPIRSNIDAAAELTEPPFLARAG